MKKLSIGQMAKAERCVGTGAAPYDKGRACFHLCTAMRRMATGIMIYAKARSWISIQRMKALGMSLKDIKKQLKHFDP